MNSVFLNQSYKSRSLRISLNRKSTGNYPQNDKHRHLLSERAKGYSVKCISKSLLYDSGRLGRGGGGGGGGKSSSLDLLLKDDSKPLKKVSCVKVISAP